MINIQICVLFLRPSEMYRDIFRFFNEKLESALETPSAP